MDNKYFNKIKEQKGKKMRLRDYGIATIAIATVILAILSITNGISPWWTLLPICVPVIAILALVVAILAFAIIEAVLGVAALLILLPIVIVLAICFDTE